MNEYLLKDFCPTESNVYRRADGLVHRIWDLPPQWENSYVIMGAAGGNIYVLFGWSATVTANPAAYSSDGGGSPAALGINADSPDRIAENTVSRFWIPRGVRQGDPAAGATTNSREIEYFGIVGDSEDAEWFAYGISEDHHR
jgi:hypothetical protein